MYALYRSGIEIYGVGETPDDARRDASQFLGLSAIGPDGCSLNMSTLDVLRHIKVLNGPNDQESHGQFYIRPCSKKLAEAVQTGPYDFKMDEQGTLCLETKNDLE